MGEGAGEARQRGAVRVRNAEALGRDDGSGVKRAEWIYGVRDGRIPLSCRLVVHDG